jgi:hypothetical protein
MKLGDETIMLSASEVTNVTMFRNRALKTFLKLVNVIGDCIM